MTNVDCSEIRSRHRREIRNDEWARHESDARILTLGVLSVLVPRSRRGRDCDWGDVAMSEPLDLDAIEARARDSDFDPWPSIETDIPALVARVRELEPRVLEGDWKTVRDALDALPEGAQIRWRTGMDEETELAIHRGHRWHCTDGHRFSHNIARDETPIEVIA